MLLSGNTDLANALAASNREISSTVKVDWSGNGLYNHTHSDLSAAMESWVLDRSAGADLPEEVELVQGFHVGSLRVRLSGTIAGTPVVELFSTFRSTSPLFGNELVGRRVTMQTIVTTASGPVSVPQFVGVLRAVEIGSRSRTVDLEFLDLAGAMTASIDMPLGGMLRADIFKSGLDTKVRPQGVVDFVLRRNGIYATPAPVSGAIMSATGHGWLSAEIGWNGICSAIFTNSISTYPYSRWPGMLAAPGSWGTSALVLAQMGVHYHCTRKYDALVSGTGMAVEGWFNVGATPAQSPAGFRALFWFCPWSDLNRRLYVAVNDTGLIRAYMTTQSGTVAGSTIDLQQTGAASWRHIGLHVRSGSSTSLTLTLRANGVSSAVTFTPTAHPPAAEHPVLFVGVHRPWSNVQAWLTGTAPTAGNWPHELTSSHVSQADIAVGNARMTYLPDIVVGESLDVLKQVVGNEFGKFGFNESGRFAFTAYDPAVGDVGNVTRTVTADYPLLDLSSGRFLDSVRNTVSAEVKEGFFNAYEVENFVEAEDPEDFESPTGVISYFPVDMQHGWAPDGGVLTLDNVTSDLWNDTKSSGWHAVRKGTDIAQVTGISVFWYATSLRSAIVVVDNQSGFDIRFNLLNAQQSSPSLRVIGVPMTPATPKVFESSDRASISSFGLASYKLGPTDWRSDSTSVSEIVGELLVQLRKPVTVLRRVPMLGDPRDQIGDLHTITDSTGIGSTRGLVQSIRRSFDRSTGYRQDVQYRVQTDDSIVTSRIWPTATP